MDTINKLNIKLLGITIASIALLLTCNGAMAGSSMYKYDSLGRLVQVTTSNGIDITISYDASGNRTIEKTAGAQVTSSQTAAIITIIDRILLSD